MRYDYIVYSKALKNLEKYNLIKKIDRCMESENGINGLYGAVWKDDLVSFANTLKEEGYFDIEKAKEFKKQLQGFFEEPKNKFWNIKRNSKNKKEEGNLEDILLMMGWFSSCVLSPKEMWDYEKFGFSSVADLNGCIGALMKIKSYRSSKREYTWETNLPDGRIFKNNITGSEHLDLRINQDDITQYETSDPLGNDVNYRPLFRADKRGVNGYHSVEGDLLISILKYIEQNNIQSELLKDNGKKFLSEIKNETQLKGPAEGFGGIHSSPMMLFGMFDVPIPKLDSDFSAKKRSHYGVPTQSGSSYQIYVGPKKELIFSFGDSLKVDKETCTSFIPEEADHLLRGLFHQCLKGLGRTPVYELINLLEYKYSDEFKKDKKILNK